MSNEDKPQPQTKGDPNPKAAQLNVEARIKEITNVNRIVVNAINLINDVEIKGAHAGPVMEIQGWLTGFSQSLTGQIKTLESTLPKKEAPKKIEPKLLPPVAPKEPAPKQTAPVNERIPENERSAPENTRTAPTVPAK